MFLKEICFGMPFALVILNNVFGAKKCQKVLHLLN